MKPIHLLPLTTALAFASCASDKNRHDTPGGAPAAAQPTAPRNESYSDAIYGSQPAYGDAAAAATSPAPDPPAYPVPAPPPVAPASPAFAPPAPPPPSPGAPSANPITHVVSKGDTLSGIATKYNVPMASIKAANAMTSDTVVLGRKLVIPQQ
ncbi:MAG: LysM peptidoglycan-binding domain-containing protein [Verrucomicrobiota bacterium]